MPNSNTLSVDTDPQMANPHQMSPIGKPTAPAPARAATAERVSR